jgi:cyclopropane fatty-acyl-phospholipid synthase-like methyltransferase
MKDAASSVLALDDKSARERKVPASEHTETGRTHWLSVIFWLIEQSWFVLLAIPTTIAGVATLLAGGGFATFALAWILVPLGGIGIPLSLILYRSRRHDDGPASWEPYVAFRDRADAARWAGRKIPMEIVYEAYLAGKLDFKADVREVMLGRNRIFRFCFTWGDLKYYLGKFLRQKLGHGLKADRNDVAPNYDRGNDFYRWFLGDSMIYTSGLFADPSETLEVAQARKLETVCKYVQMQPGDRHLDIGCGWGGLLVHAAREHGTVSTGITLSKEQAIWANDLALAAGVRERVRIQVDDYRNLPSERFDKITCLEMAEHVGIRNFQKFLLQVSHMLEDDGIFYLQIAGLRRPWQYEDLVWGLFMSKYIFPGADASCPLAFVVSQVERAGFEVHRVENCGAHYSVTIQKWYENWKRHEGEIVASYGERWFRLWLLFLGWSSLTAAQGSAALFLLTMTKNNKSDKSSVTPEEAVAAPFSRQHRWIGRNPIATQL